jgi:hypothetical protein
LDHLLSGSGASLIRLDCGLGLFFTGAALILARYGDLLLVEPFDAHGSLGGDVLLVALGLIFLVLSLAAVIAS